LIIEGLLLALLCFSPLALGVVAAWSEQVVVILAGVMVFCFALKFLLRPDTRPIRTWAYVPLALFLLLVCFQIAPLPEGLLSLLSPETLKIKKNLMEDQAGTDLALTFYTAGTLHDLRLMLTVAAVFVCALHVFRHPGALRRLLMVISTLGAALAVLAIAQIITGSGKIYWFFEAQSTDVARGGPFVNRNNFCMFMNLSLGASLTLLLLKVNEGLDSIPRTLPSVLDWITSSRARWVWLLAGVIVVSMAAVFLSLSRGGMIALLFAITLSSMVMAVRRRLDGRAWIMVFLTLGALICVLFLGFDAVYDRLATLEDQHAYEDRWSLAKNAALAWTRFPILGTGLGTHEVVFPMFNRANNPSLFEFVENEYVQTAEETGALGLIFVASFLFVVSVNYRRCLGAGGMRATVAYGLGFSLVASMVHSVGDFGLHLPANACLAATFCGVLVGLGNPMLGTELNPNAIRRKLLVFLGVASVVLVWGWAMFTANEARLAERHWKQALRLEAWMQGRDWLAGNRAYADLISHTASAVEFDPGNIKYRYWLAVYRWRSISRVADPKTGNIALTGKSRKIIRRIVRDLHEARLICPTFGPMYCVAGQLERFILGLEIGSKHIRTGYELAPSHPTACFVAGLLDAKEGHHGEALSRLKRAYNLDNSLFDQIAFVLVRHLKKPDLALELAGEDSRRLGALEPILAGQEEYRVLAENVKKRTIEALIKECKAPDAPAGKLAHLAALHHREGEYEAAETCYLRALDMDYAQVRWRYELARVCAARNQTEEAIRQARICLRLRPQMDAAKQLISDLTE